MRLDNHVLSLKTFKQVALPDVPQGMVSSVYLYNRPVSGVDVTLSEKPIVLGAHGKLFFVSVADSYRIGYLIQSVRAYTIVDANFVMVGRTEDRYKRVKQVEVLHTDANLHVIRCRTTNSHLIVPVCTLDFPKVEPLAYRLEEEE